jgi:hypothetical protein
MGGFVIPNRLEHWNIDAIEHLLSQGYFEPEHFDYKEMLPHRNNKEEKRGLVKDCCAFANSSGGFLIFGVDNDKNKSPVNRLVGIDPSVDFPEHFGNYPTKCRPTVQWAATNPPLGLSNGKKIYVVYIPRSWNAPHCFEDPDRHGWLSFPKRTNKGNEDMSYEEIMMSFLQYYEKRLKLQLLRSELENLKRQSFGLPGLISASGMSNLGDFGLLVIETILADSYTILASNRELLDLLTDIRNVCRMVNAQTQYFLTNVTFMSNPAQVQHHNALLRSRCDQISRNCQQAVGLLDQVLAA